MNESKKRKRNVQDFKKGRVVTQRLKRKKTCSLSLVQEAEKLSKLTQSLQTYLQEKQWDLFSVCAMTKNIIVFANHVFQVASNQKQSWSRLPAELTILIASFSDNPSIRQLGMTCRSWYQTMNHKRTCVQWTRAVCQSIWVGPILESRSMQESDDPLALMEFSWVNRVIEIPVAVQQIIVNLCSASSSEGVTAWNGRFRHYLLKDWKKIDEKAFAYIENGTQILAMDLTPQRLRFIITTASYEKGRFFTVTRTSDGSFPRPVEHGYVVFPYQTEPHEAHAWSSDSVFFLLGGCSHVIEFDFEQCRERARYSISNAFRYPPLNVKRWYMTFFDGLLIVGAKWRVLDHTDVPSGNESDSSDPDSDSDDDRKTYYWNWYIKMGIIHCRTHSCVMLPEKACLEDDIDNHLTAILKVHGQPLVGLSFGICKDLVKFNSRIHVWHPRDAALLFK